MPEQLANEATTAATEDGEVTLKPKDGAVIVTTTD